VVVGHRAEVARRPAVHEVVRPHARHAPLGHLRDFEVREEGQLEPEDRVEVRILRRVAAVGVQQRLRFVQVVNDWGFRSHVPVEQRAHRHQRHVEVAVVVVKCVLAPVGQLPATAATTARSRRLRVGLISIKPVDVAVASIRLGRRRYGHDHVVADLRDERRGFRREAIDQLHQHLGRARFTAVQSAHQVVLRLGGRDELFDLLRRQSAGIGELLQVRGVLREILDVLVRRDVDGDHVAAFVGLADDLHLHARCRFFERAVVLEDVGVVGQRVWRADVVAEDVLRRRDAFDERQMVDERTAVVRIAGPFLVELRELFVLSLLRVPRLGDHLLGRQGGDGQEKEGQPCPKGQCTARRSRRLHHINSLTHNVLACNSTATAVLRILGENPPRELEIEHRWHIQSRATPRCPSRSEGARKGAPGIYD